MPEGAIIFVAAVFALAGIVKGVIGLGLPTISMGLLAIVMPPVEAAALLILPSFVTNIWQMWTGRSIIELLRRLWPMMVAVCLGTWAASGLMSGSGKGGATLLLGIALALYALSGLATFKFAIPAAYERPLGAAAGALTGVITAATGVFVIPAVPFLQGIGLEKNDLVQALGLAFTVSTVALAVNVGAEVGVHRLWSLAAILALAAAGAGMAAGQLLRHRLSPEAFRRWFFSGLLVLGAYLAMRSVG